MRRRSITVMVGSWLAVVLSSGLFAANRLPTGTTVEFIVPVGTGIGMAELVVFTGPVDLTVGLPGNCTPAVGDSGPLQEVLSIDPGAGGSHRATVIVTQVAGVWNPGAVPLGTRLGPLTALNVCGSTNDFQKYRGTVE